ncbi:MAG: DUF4292 domain-containing protein [Desulfobacterales bacterium]
MKNISYKAEITALCFAVSFFLSGCTGLTGAVSKTVLDRSSPVADNLLSRVKNTNLKLKTFKGIGKVRVRNKEGFQVLRIAWAAWNPRKIRMEILGISGQPVASLASDGDWIYVYLHGERRYYKKPAYTSFQNFFSLPLGSIDLIALMSGRVPIAGHHHVLLKRDPVSGRYALILKKKPLGLVEKIYFDQTKENVAGVERFNYVGDLLYRAKIERFQNIGGYTVPAKLIISTDMGEIFKLDIEKYWVNVPVSSQMFALEPPKPVTGRPILER